MITRPRIPEIGTLDALIKSYIEAKFQLSRVLRLACYEQINPHLPKFANNNNGITRSCKVPIVTNYNTFQTFVELLEASAL